MNPSIEFARKFAMAYHVICKPLCQELDLPQTAFDILMFLGNNPAYRTASDIVEIRYIKANLVSIHVERLVQNGYLVRQPVKGDLRKTELLCTDKAQPIIDQGRQLQALFFEKLFYNTEDEMRSAFLAAMNLIEENLDAILEEAK